MMSSVILLAMQMILLSTLNVTEQLQQLELASELQSNLQDTIDQGFPRHYRPGFSIQGVPH